MCVMCVITLTTRTTLAVILRSKALVGSKVTTVEVVEHEADPGVAPLKLGACRGRGCRCLQLDKFISLLDAVKVLHN